MKIAVNARFLFGEELEGIGRYSYETLKRMVEDHPEDEFLFYFDRKINPEYILGPNVTTRVLFPPARHPLLWFIWFEMAVADALRKEKPDVFYSPDGYLCLNTNVPTLMVVHDLAFEHYPGHIPRLARRYYQYYSPRYARKADRIAAVSTATKEDLIESYNVYPDKIFIAYNGCREAFQPVGEEQRERQRKLISGGDPFFLFVGAIHPRKNPGGLLKAFEIFKEKTSLPHKLVMVGRKAWMLKSFEEKLGISPYRDEVIFPGYLDTEGLALVTASAQAMVYPSFFEGFGVPILEAMRSGVPVITSDRSSMPEVCGQAGLLVDPGNSESIAEAMIEVATSPLLREKMINSGLEQAKRFDWDETADRIYENLCTIARPSP